MDVDSLIPTRATLRREYEQSIPVGEEAEVFLAAATEVDEAVVRLRDLREIRVGLARRASEHRRKLHDWKGKVPREQGTPAPDAARNTQGDMPCVEVARIVRLPRAASSRGDGALRFLPRYVRALEGVQRFSKVWVVVLSRGDVDVAEATGRQPAVCQHPSLVTTGQLRVNLVLVDVIERRGPSAVDKDLLVINGLNSEAILKQEGETFVVDVKPYLSYCEAFPVVQAQESSSPPSPPLHTTARKESETLTKQSLAVAAASASGAFDRLQQYALFLL
jgi:tRNA (Thr-GGU) A37 N-methylase